MPPHWARVTAANIALCAAVAGGGCARDGTEVPTLDGPTVSPVAKPPQRVGAELYYACLLDAGLPANLDPVQGSAEGEARVGWDEDHVIMWRLPISDGPSAGVVTSDNATLPQEQIDAFLMQTEPAYALNVDGTDHSDAYRACYEQSGYTEPAFQSDPAQVLESKQELAESTNDWIACARENGYPQLADVTPSTILDVWPTAELPLTITPVALRNLLQDCPNFNEQLAWQQLSSEAYDDRWKPDPSISFALPGGPSGLSSHPDDPDTVRLRELTAILYEKQELFWRDQIDPSPTRHS